MNHHLRDAALLATALFTSTPSIAADIRFPLTTTQDYGKNLDAQRATDARTLAHYAITKEKVLKYYPNQGDGFYQGVRAILLTSRWVYAITVENYDERGENSRPDTITIEMRRKGSSKQDTAIMLKDMGLDGHCNEGIIPKQFSGTKGDDISFPTADTGKATEYEAAIQRMYHGALDTLLRFYEER